MFLKTIKNAGVCLQTAEFSSARALLQQTMACFSPHLVILTVALGFWGLISHYQGLHLAPLHKITLGMALPVW